MAERSVNNDPARRRGDERLNTALTVQVRSTARRCYGTMYDISPSGAFVAVDSPPGAGARLKIAIRMGDKTDLVLDAEVRYSTSDMGARLSAGVGIQFVDLTDAQREALTAIVERLRHGQNARGIDDADDG
jgi:hypothetical protein